MADEQGMEKTEKATPKRRREAREKGKVAKSVELNTAMMLGAAVLLIVSFYPHVVNGLKESFVVFFSYAGNSRGLDHELRAVLMTSMSKFFAIIAPIMVGTMVVGFVTNVMQVGFQASVNSLEPKFERVSPISGFKRVFGKRSLVELAKGTLKILLIALVGWLTYKSRIDDLVLLTFVPAQLVLPQAVSLAAAFLIRVVIALGVIAVLDFSYQKWDFEKSIMMTKQELKQELKESEGDPILRGRVRSMQQKLAQQRMMDDVKHADVVITNPTHYAVALGYSEEDGAPKVLAKGMNFIAQKIKEIAREHDVPVIEKPQLARLLYKEVEIGKLVPTVFFEAIAEVLAYVYALRGKAKR